MIQEKLIVKEDGVIITLERNETIVKVHKYGATVISWKHKGRELLYVSPLAKLDGTKAIRGGIPIVFPRFGPSDLFPNQQHGFARNSRWDFSHDKDVATFTLSWEEAQFKPSGNLSLKVSIGDKGELELCLRPEFAGSEGVQYHMLLHTYFKVDLAKTHIKGLDRANYGEKQEQYEKHPPTLQVLSQISGLDRMYFDVDNPINLKDGQMEMRLESREACDVVVWNPGKEMTDVPASDVNSFVCIEHGLVSKLQTNSHALRVTYTPMI